MTILTDELALSSSDFYQAEDGRILTVNKKWLIPLGVTQVYILSEGVQTGSWVKLRRATTKGVRPVVKFLDGIYVQNGVPHGQIYPEPAEFEFTELDEIDLVFDGRVWTRYPLSTSNDSVILGELQLSGTGNITIPPNVTQLIVNATAGGGGGGGAAMDDNAAHTNDMSNGGGAGGGGSINVTIPVTPGEVIPYSIGAGGVGGLVDITASEGATNLTGEPGGDGGETKFGPTLAGDMIRLFGGKGGHPGKIVNGETSGNAGFGNYGGSGTTSIGTVIQGSRGGQGWDVSGPSIQSMSGGDISGGGNGYKPRNSTYGEPGGGGATLFGGFSSGNHYGIKGAGGCGGSYATSGVSRGVGLNGANGYLYLIWN